MRWLFAAALLLAAASGLFLVAQFRGDGRAQGWLACALVFGLAGAGAIGLRWARALARVALLEARLTRGEARFQALFDAPGAAAALVAADGRIERAGVGFCRLLGYPPGALDGVELHALADPAGRADTLNRLRACLAGDEEAGAPRLGRYRGRADAWLGVTMARLEGDEDSGARVLVVAQELTAEAREREALRRLASLAAHAAGLAAVGSWSLGLRGLDLRLGEHAPALIGFDPGVPVNVRALCGCLPEASRRQLLAAVRACRRARRELDIEIALCKPGGERIDVRVTGRAVVERGLVRRIEGAFQDVTPIRRKEHALRRSEQQFRAIAWVTNDAIWDLDVDSGKFWHSGTTRQTLNTSSHGNDMDQWLELIHPSDRPAVERGFQLALNGKSEHWEAEYRYLRLDGKYGYLADRARILRDESGRALRVVGGTTDLTERKRIQAAMMKIAASVPVAQPGEFYQALLGTLVEGLGADGGCIARLRDDGSGMARTLAAVADGGPVENFDYLVTGTPCENLLGERECIVPDELSVRFPDAGRLGGLAARAYVGGQLRGAGGKVLGFIFVLYRVQLGRSELLNSALQVFATRAAAEIERVEVSLQLREQAELLDHAKEAIVVLDLDLNVRFWNRGAEAMCGWTREQAVGRPIVDRYLDAEAVRAARSELLRGDQWHGEFRKRGRNGATLTVEENWSLIRTHDGEPHSILKIGTDVTDKKLAEEQIRRLAYYDSLTGLPNRRLFLDRLEAARVNGARTGRHAALMFIDMDNFKIINDVHGHHMGDEFLRSTAQRLGAVVRADDLVARLGGDEFVIVLEDLDGSPEAASEKAAKVGANLVRAFNEPIWLGGMPYRATGSIGITLFRDERCAVDELLRQADFAMYEAKDRGRNTVCLFDATLESKGAGRAILAMELRRALNESEFALWYQPQVGADGRLYGAEALMRWQHPQQGMVPPVEFIALAERSSFILELGEWALRAACRQLAAWAVQPGLAQLQLSVNISVQQLRQERFVEQVLGILRESGADPASLTLEVTESVLDDKFSGIPLKIQRLRDAGVHFSLDDFGTGYSSLARLRQLPIDELKIDRAFVRDAVVHEDDAAIVLAILSLGQALRMRVVAEGVETQEQRDFLAGHGCPVFQGYLYAPALPPERFAEFAIGFGATLPTES